VDLSKLSDADLQALKAGNLGGVSDAGLMALKGDQAEPTPEPENFALETAKNVPRSAWEFTKNIAHAVTNPVQTLSNLQDLAAGGLRAATPTPIRDVLDRADVALGGVKGNQRVRQAADAFAQFYKDRYGSAESTKNSVKEDPVGVLADASMVLGVGGLTNASRLTNPLSVLNPVANVAGKAGKSALGITTGVGPETVTQAARAGIEGNKSFLANMRGEVSMTDVLDKAKAALENMRVQKSAEYRNNMAAVKSDKTVLDFGGIDRAVSEAAEMVSFKGQAKNESASRAVQKMADDVQVWKQFDPAEFHTPEGLDALKQRLGGVMETIPYEQKTARLAAGKVYNSVKSEIEKQAPIYSKTMADYAKASDEITEIERALSLGDRAAKDTAMRKLQSLTRNNVNTNYGNRTELAKALEKGGADILPDVAGQAMSQLAPRGLVGQAGGLSTLGAAIYGTNPYALLGLPFQSPRAVGSGLYYGGRGVGLLGDALKKRGVTGDKARLSLLLSEEAGR
jgi:hypothetical protein